MASREDLLKTKAVAEIRRRVDGSNQAHVARELQWDEPALSRLLRGERGVGLVLMQRAEKHGGIPMSWWARPAGEAA